jgi:hypothetical protein
MLHRYEQATGQALRQRVVVDREGMAAAFLAHLHQEGRQVVTLLRAAHYEGEASFEQVGQWQPWRYNRHGQLICEVASARFAPPATGSIRSSCRGRGSPHPRLAQGAGGGRSRYPRLAGGPHLPATALLGGRMASVACAPSSHYPETHPGDDDGARHGNDGTGPDLLPPLELEDKTAFETG